LYTRVRREERRGKEGKNLKIIEIPDRKEIRNMTVEQVRAGEM